MNRLELRQRVEDYLQDRDNRRWEDSELNRYISDAQREFIRLVEYPHVTAEVDFVSGSGVSGTLTVDNKTAKITTSVAHGLSTDDAVWITDTTQSVFSGGKVIRKVDDTSFTYQISTATAVSDSTVTYYHIGPNVTKPSSIEKVVHAEIEGVQLMILTEGELNSAVWRTTTSGQFIEGVFGTVPNPFTTIQTTLTGTGAYTESWSERTGHIEAIVFNSMTQDNFRIWPLPNSPENIYVDKDSTTKVFKKIKLRGTPLLDDLSTDSSVPSISTRYHECLVWGALERAFLKESQSKDVNKSELYKARFMQTVSEAKSLEGMVSSSNNEGRNESRFRVARIF